MWKVIGQSGYQHKIKGKMALCGVPASPAVENPNGKKCPACIGRNGGRH